MHYSMEEIKKQAEYLQYLEAFITENRKNKFLEVLEKRTNHFTVAIEDVYQLHNTSAVMRSCEVFGIQNLHVVEEKFGKRIDKEIAMGAQKWVGVNRYDSNIECVKSLKAKGYRIIATTPHQDDCLLDSFDISEPAAIFFGTERNGLSEEIMKEADGFLKIPMSGFTESLNISVSAAIIIQNLMSHLHRSGFNWHLSEEEMLSTRLAWTKNSIKDIKRIEQRYREMNNLD
ncbi:MAG TPA: RNA methyltransferase [Flavobacterium sp.]|nr:RNA methyltransferase [Flavobacterium sp.]